jgi:hypothetical protein
MMYFTLSPEAGDIRSDLLRLLHDTKTVTYLAELGGELRHKAVFCVRNIREIKTELLRLSARFGRFIRSKQIAGMVSMTDFPLQLDDHPSPALAC